MSRFSIPSPSRPAKRAFREALDRDPACAIATWGIATILIGNTFALGPSPENAERAVAAIERGRAIGAKTQRERDYIEAIAAFYDRFAERPQAARMRSLADAFEALAARYNDDDETQIFSALYLTASQPLRDKSYARALKAAAILDAQFAKHPDHPGVAHYLIHAYDFPPIAQKGLPAALCYADIAPGASHALHMPSHIFTRVGLWKELIETNVRSAAAAKAENNHRRRRCTPWTTWSMRDLQLARDADALAVVKDARGFSTPAVVSSMPVPQYRRATRWNAINGAEAAALRRSSRQQISLYRGNDAVCARCRRRAQRRLDGGGERCRAACGHRRRAESRRTTIIGRPKSRRSAAVRPHGSLCGRQAR